MMVAVYIDKKGRVRFSLFCENPKLPRRERGICGAKTRTGTPCQAPPVWNKVIDKPRNGRCKLHGGLSTGAKTEAGRNAIRAGNKARRRNIEKR